MKLRNETTQRQQVFLINGEALNVQPGEVVEVDVSLFYAEEIVRLSKCFKVIEEVAVRTPRPPRNKKVQEETPKEVPEEKEEDGGNE